MTVHNPFLRGQVSFLMFFMVRRVLRVLLPVLVAREEFVDPHMHGTKIVHFVVRILVQHSGVVVESFQDVEEDDSEDTADDRPDPVNPCLGY